jgi:hypothetical protein
MTFPDRTGQPPGWTAPAATASELLRLHRDQVVAYTTTTTTTTYTGEPGAPTEGGEVSVTPLSRADLPPDVVRLLERYEAEHPDVRLTPLRYVSVGPPDESTAAAADAALPGERDLVSLAITESVVDAEEVEVRSRVLLAALAPRATG